MRSKFPEWYEPSDDEIRDFVQRGVVALDTNCLFSLYRVNAHERSQVLGVLKSVGDRLWIPYQVGLEYQRGRLERIKEQGAAYDKVKSEVKSLKDVVENNFRDKRIREQLREKVEEFEQQIGSTMDRLHADNSVDFDSASKEDPVRDALDSFLCGPDQIGRRPADLDTRVQHARERLADKIPPGFKDANKPDPTGDCLIWFELLDLGESRPDLPILFVTDDNKPDWYRKDEGKTIGPRPELRLEWAKEDRGAYHQTSLKSFLHHAQTHLPAPIDDETIESVAASDPRLSSMLSKLRHPSVMPLLLRLASTTPGSPAAATAQRALDMIEGGARADSAAAKSAIELLDLQPRVENELRTLLTNALAVSKLDDGTSGSLDDLMTLVGRLLALDEQGLVLDPALKEASSLAQAKIAAAESATDPGDPSP